MATERDPVCEMTVDSESAAASMVEDGQRYYFCSSGCRDRFAANPASFSAAGGREAGGERMERHEPPRTTTGNFTAPKFGSAGSGGLEYEPLPEAHDHDRDDRR